MSGSVAMYTVEKDGRLIGPVDFIQHQGFGKDPVRQSGPHAHAVVFEPRRQILYVPDLGMDTLVLYKLDRDEKKLVHLADLDLKTAAGAGPRYMEIHPNGKWAFLINELDSTVSLVSLSGKTAKIETIHTIPLLPKDFSGTSTASDLHLSPDGRHLYCSNRGDDSIVAIEIDQETGTMKTIGRFPCGGKTPRNFMITRDGRYVIAANQDSDMLVSFRRDTATGLLTATGYTVEAPTPVCVRQFS